MKHSQPIIFGVVLVTTLIIFAQFSTPLLAIYHQIRGGQYLNMATQNQDIDQITYWACEGPSPPDAAHKDNLKLAIKHLQAALEKYPRLDQAALLLGRAYCQNSDLENAFKAFRLYTELRPHNPLGYIELGYAFEAICRQQYPEQYSKGSISTDLLCPDTDETSRIRTSWEKASLKPDDFVSAGNEALDRGILDDSLINASRALILDRENAEALYLIARIRAHQERYSEADDWFKKAIEKDPTNASWYMERAKTAETAGSPDLAIEIYKQIIVMFPEKEDAYILLGNLYYLGNFGLEAALAEFKRAIMITPDSGEGYFAAGEVLSKESRCKEADDNYRQAIEREPDKNWWYLARGDNLRDCGEIESAIDVYLQAVRLFPDYALAYHQLAWAYYLNLLYQDAIEAIKKSQILFGDDIPAWSYERASIIYEASGNIDQAIECLSHILINDPKNERIIEKIERLETLKPSK